MRAGRATVLLAAVGVLALAASWAHASQRLEDRDRAGRPELVAPVEGVRLAESDVRIAFETPRGWGHTQLLLSRRPFDPTGWTEIPTISDLAVYDASRPILSLDDLGVTLDSDTRFWWAVAVRGEESGPLRVSAVRSFTALRRFSNRVAPSPYLPPATTGVLDAGREAGAVAGTGSAPPRLHLEAGYEFAPAQGEPALPAALTLTEEGGQPSTGSSGLASYLVQFAAPPGDTQLEAITRVGGEVIGYIPDQAYLVRMSPEARARFDAQGLGAWVVGYQPAYKLSPLANREAGEAASYKAWLFPDADPAAVRAQLVGLGAEITTESHNGINSLIAFRSPGTLLASVAAVPDVAWIERVIPMVADNDNAQWVVQTNVNGSRRVWDMGIRGQGQVIMTSDSGVNTGHNQFRDPAVTISGFGDYPTHRKVIAYKLGGTNPLIEFGDHAGASYHGTHTAGTVVGSDDPTANVSLRDGMAKEAKLYFMDISGSAMANSVEAFIDLNDLFLPSYLGNAGGAARLSSNSWGGAAAGAYTLDAMNVDQFMWNHPDYLISFSNGNAGTAGSVGTPATAKNSIGSGATQNGTSDNQIGSFTSRGPTADGRRKPTVCSPGQSIFSADGSGTTGYQPLTGTSMSCPTGLGAIALVREYLTEGWYPSGAPVPANAFTPSAALMKAIAVNSADNGVVGFTAPDFNIGYGRIDIDNALYFTGDARKLLLVDNTAGLGNGQYVDYQVNVTDASQPFEVTLCWTDYPGNPAASIQLVNNLDLTVSQGPTVYKGNVYSLGSSVTGGTYDDRNVEEAVLITVPTAGVWTVRVAGTAVPLGPQPFALCMTGGVGNGAGALALDRAEYGSASTMQIQVIDANAGGTVNVNVISGTESAPESVTLFGAGGVYGATLALSPLSSGADDGTLTVSNGDLITATYQDASPVATLIANAHVNFDTPVITNVAATSQGGSGTLVTWTTDRNASSRVYYGLTPSLELGSVDATGAALNHQVLLTGLTPGTNYYYDVESVALSGSSSRDDLGGAHHQFTAEGSRDVLLVYGDPAFGRAPAWDSALQAGGFAVDVWRGPSADNPRLGNLTSGLRSYKAVIWQVGFDQYPPFAQTPRDTLTAYLAGGGRLLAVGHDIGWAFGDPSSPYYSVDVLDWLHNTLKATFLADPSTYTQVVGLAADPISGAYTGGIAYTPIRAGGAGDQVGLQPASGGTGAFVWRDNFSPTPGNNGFRWESDTPNGSAGTAFWGGLPSRLATMFFEFTALTPPYTSPSATRNDVLNKTLAWLFGRTAPSVALTSPNGGESLTGSSTNITWTESVAGGFAVGSRTLEYSTDGGGSWALITGSAGPSPYSWDLSSVPNTAQARVRVRITDNGTPALGATDMSNANFAVNRAGNDAQGPLVVAGSIATSPNPIVRPDAATLAARVSDLMTGGSNVSAAEWSIGASPAAAGAGTALAGAFGTVTVDVSGSLDTSPFLPGARKLWVRAQDAAGNWGPASSLDLIVNGPDPTSVESLPPAVYLSSSAPNPFGEQTSIGYGLPASARVELAIYDLSGRRVRRLVDGEVPGGRRMAVWDGSDDSGQRVPSGMYYCRLVTPTARLERRIVALR